MFLVTYKNIKVIPSLSATRELIKEGKTMWDVLQILEEGYFAPRKRKQGTIEKWFNKGRKIFNAVIVRNYDCQFNEEVWILIHFGKFTKKG